MNVTALDLIVGFSLGAFASNLFLTQSLANAIVVALITGMIMALALYIVEKLEEG